MVLLHIRETERDKGVAIERFENATSDTIIGITIFNTDSESGGEHIAIAERQWDAMIATYLKAAGKRTEHMTVHVVTKDPTP